MAASADELQALGERAAELITDGMVVGLGTGKAASAFVRALGERVKGGLRVRGVPTSDRAATLGQQVGIPLATFDQIDAIDVDVDGADEIAPNGDAIKGYGGAMVREKVVAAASKEVVLLVGDEKLVPPLGARGKLPVEVLTFALPFCSKRLAAIGLVPKQRLDKQGAVVVTDNGNHILDCGVPTLENATAMELAITAIPGVVGTGLFVAVATTVLVARGGGGIEEWAFERG